MEFLRGVAVEKVGTVALGALGQDWTHRGISQEVPPTPRQPYPSPLGLPALLGLHHLLSFGLFCSESDARLPAGVMPE